MTDHHIAKAGVDGLFWLVVIVVTIIAQIVKASKRGSTGSGPPPPRPGTEGDGGYTAPQDELRAFLESLTGAPKKPATPPPPPMQAVPARAAAPAAPRPVMRTPEAKTAPKPKRRVTRTAAAAAAARQLAPVPPAPRPQPRPRQPVAPARPPLPQLATKAADAYGRGTVIGGTAKARPGITTRLRGRRSVREAVILREILGEPLAMRASARPASAAQR